MKYGYTILVVAIVVLFVYTVNNITKTLGAVSQRTQTINSLLEGK